MPDPAGRLPRMTEPATSDILVAGAGATGLLDKVVVQGRTWSIVPPLKEVNPAGTPILYELAVRS